MTLWMGRMSAEWASEGRLSAAKHFSLLMAGLTAFGVLRNQLAAISMGGDPEPLNDAKVWIHGMLQGGGFGIWGDFMHASENRFGGGVAETMAGPQAAMIGDLLKFSWGSFSKELAGEKTNPGREFMRLLHNHTPGSNLWYTQAAFDRILLDTVQEFVDPEAHKAFGKRIHDRYQQHHAGYWWAPGDSLPAHAPDFGNLVRQ